VQQQQQQQNPTHTTPTHRKLQQLLTSFDVNNEAKPLVLSYKNAINAIPLSTQSALFLRGVRELPSVVALFFAAFQTATTSYAVLLPLIVVEVVIFYGLDVFGNDDSMAILLAGDVGGGEGGGGGGLWRVWLNTKRSVVALEKGLTAVRCAQTTAHGVEFATNLVSLARVGVDVYVSERLRASRENENEEQSDEYIVTLRSPREAKRLVLLLRFVALLFSGHSAYHYRSYI